MGKYIITFEDYPQIEEDGVKFYSCNEAPWWYASEQIISKLTPYTEHDTEQVREDAFKNGYDAACKDIDVKSKINAAYRKGLEDAWETVEELFGFTFDEQATIFKTTSVRDIVRKYSASETIKKIRQYEQEQEEIKVGDEVIGIYSSGEQTKPFVITKWDSNCYFGIYSDSGKPCQG